ncbi:GTPase IMAP family member 4-like [Pomacea canaliculata]|uniref:GTPase IMAP family member 4-like n=1 Tax=Pomacea canaliculata TaxID=400727 RepID=UPI000D7346A2|nr:GTPase IMAP family member 4-like [Pomacea canaliculata]XP_025111184.1 GTPase IMAP family member 4-like [Pomacea canaliculata]
MSLSKMSTTIKVFIIGKTGNGKSLLANSVLGREEFLVARSMRSTTVRHGKAVGVVNGQQIMILDTPDPVNLNLSDTEIKDEVSRWKSAVEGPYAILLAVRCDVRYTAEEYDIYKKIKKVWGDNSFTGRLVVVFTFGDRQDRNIQEELKTVCWELRNVLADAGGRYVLFNNMARGSEMAQQVGQLLKVIQRLDMKSADFPITQPQVLILVVLVVIFVIVWVCIIP